MSSSRAILCLISLLSLTQVTFALEQHNAFLALSKDTPPSLLARIQALPIYNYSTGTVRFIPAVHGMSKQRFAAHMDSLATGDGMYVEHLTAANSGRSTEHSAMKEWQCLCHELQPFEFLISETPVRRSNGPYVSINDETYKAISEVRNYPTSTELLNAIALSELVYSNNLHLIQQHLERQNQELLVAEGFLNSANNTGFRDTQFLVAKSSTRLYVAVRGTSEAIDAETTFDAEPVSFLDSGLAHRGYADVARHVYSNIQGVIRNNELPIVLTGHSLGGSVALLVTLLLEADGVDASNINFSPVPPVDQKTSERTLSDTTIHNYFLPGDEIESLETHSNWLRLPGKRIAAPDVGLTQGRTHYVINYLKSMLVTSGYSQSDYEQALPDCVVTKYPCFTDNPIGLISGCALSHHACFESQFEYLVGYPVMEPPENIPEPSGKSLSHHIERNTKRLVMTLAGSHERTVLTLRLSYLHLAAGNIKRAKNLLTNAELAGADGFIGFLSKQIERHETTLNNN